MDVDVRKIVVVVEDSPVSRTALLWALHNILRFGDLVTLLHVYQTPIRNKKKQQQRRNLRLKGFQLALAFRDICCNKFPNTKIEIVVAEGDGDEGERIGAVVREIGASTLVFGLHQNSFIYKLVMSHNNITRHLNCKVFAIKESTPLSSATISIQGTSSDATNMGFSQIEIATLSFREVLPQKIEYQICPDPRAIIWRSRP